MKKSKKIGIFAWKTGDNSLGVTAPYYEYFKMFGDPYMISPLADPDLSNLDLVVVPGGADIAPSTYGYVPSLATGKSDPIKEFFDAYIIPKVINAGIPMFGICRGHQALAVRHGLHLIQNMFHETSEAHKRFDKVHEITINTNLLPYKSSLRAPKNSNTVVTSVNSLHHQVVANGQTLSDLVSADVVKVIARHKSSKTYDDTYIEALYYPQINSITVQWHPEEAYDTFSEEAVNYLLSINKKTESKNEDDINK